MDLRDFLRCFFAEVPIIPPVLPPMKKYPVLDGEEVPIVGRLGNTHLDILPFFLSDF
jgi:hypothetical protein